MSRRKKPLTESQRRKIVTLQNKVRNAINVSVSPGRKTGVKPADLKAYMRSAGLPVHQMTLRAQRLPTGSEFRADYKLWLDGELLFRLKLVPWPDGHGARWHVKRHPEALWWRTPSRGSARRRTGRPSARPRQRARTRQT